MSGALPPSRHAPRAIALAVLLVAAALAGCTTATVQLPSESPPLFVTAWGGTGGANGKFVTPTGVALDAAGNVYVTDSANHRVQKFSPAGVFLAAWGSLGSAAGQMKFPTAIAVGPTGDVYVADSYNYRVQRFTPTGSFLGAWGSQGGGDGKFQMPRGIGIDSAGNVFVSDATNHNVQKFTSTGTFLARWGGFGTGDGQFNAPRGVAVSPSGLVYVADFKNNRVQWFDGAGAFGGKWGSLGSGDGELDHPYGVAVDAAGSVFVTDVNNDRVQKFTFYGGLLAKWGTTGTAGAQFNEPYGIAVDAATHVYVVDGANNRLEKFRYLPNTIDVDVLLDGTPWSGPVSFTIGGPQTFAGASAPHYSAPAQPGAYTVTYVSGGPAGASLVGGVTTPPKTLVAGDSIAFTLNFTMPTILEARATLDGLPWSGPLSYKLWGVLDTLTWTLANYTGSAVPHAFANSSVGSSILTDPATGNSGPAAVYFPTYFSGGPPGATLASVQPSAGMLFHHGTATFTFHFFSPGVAANSVLVNATLDGAPWSGPVSYQLSLFEIPQPPGTTWTASAAPQTFSNLPQSNYLITDPLTGTTQPSSIYVVTYLSGGPPGATFTGYLPDFFTVLPTNGTKRITLEFESPVPTTGDAIVSATLDGAPWTGPLGHSLAGPTSVTGASASQTHAGLAPGSYTLSVTSGGPPGASLAVISPSATQTVAVGGTTTFTAHYRTIPPPAGTIVVEATLAGAVGPGTWTGPLNFTIAGPQAFAGSAAPATFAGAPVGAYTLTYVSGGPPGASLHSITSAPTQTLAAGGTITFRLNFR